MPPQSPRLSIWAAALLLIGLVQAQSPAIDRFTKDLPIPAQKHATMNIPIAGTDQTIAYYELSIEEFDQKVYGDDLKTPMVGYDGKYPGPTIIVQQGQQSVVRFVNKVSDPERNSTIHLHGSATRAPWDGWAEDQIKPGFFKDYYYPNYQSARMLWYHDHVLDKTRDNVLKGQAGAYIIANEAEDSKALGMTFKYSETDIPLIISARGYTADGALDVWGGDVYDVNGQAWPVIRVEPRKYRLRFLNADVRNSFNISFLDSGDNHILFNMIASDAGLFKERIDAKWFEISPAERYEIIMDFKEFRGTNIALNNAGAFDPQMMRFVVSDTPSLVDEPTEIPKQLRSFDWPQLPASPTVQNFTFGFSDDGLSAINGKTWDHNNPGAGPQELQRVLANVSLGTVEQWNFIGVDTHPVHTHLIDFHVVSRISQDPGSPVQVQPYEAAGLKDVVHVRHGETVTVEAIYGPWDGLYMMHCHNLDHEDSQMIGAFNVTNLGELGYVDSAFTEPMDPKWQPKEYSEEAMKDTAVRAAVNELAAAKPYSTVQEINARLKL